MSDHSATTPPSGKADHVASLEARLAEIEAGLLDELSFTSKELIQTTFPHSKRAGKEVILVNGAVTVTMWNRHGLPYGAYPRFLLCWVTREALRRQNLPLEEARVIPLEGSLAGFMREVGIPHATGGKDGTIARLKKQLQSLFGTHIGVDIEGDKVRDRTLLDMDESVIAERTRVWWTPREDDDEIDFHGHITLSAPFFRSLVEGAVPLNTRMLHELRRSPLAIDIYAWLSYRLSYHRGITVITWKQLRGQFGAGYTNNSQGMRNFRRKFLEAFDRVLEVWPEATAEFTNNGLMLKPGEPSVPRRVGEELKRHRGEGAAPF